MVFLIFDRIQKCHRILLNIYLTSKYQTCTKETNRLRNANLKVDLWQCVEMLDLMSAAKKKSYALPSRTSALWYTISMRALVSPPPNFPFHESLISTFSLLEKFANGRGRRTHPWWFRLQLMSTFFISCVNPYLQPSKFWLHFTRWRIFAFLLPFCSVMKRIPLSFYSDRTRGDLRRNESDGSAAKSITGIRRISCSTANFF